jgi:DNA-binding transcriptional regulator LsrR (DeoR family)
VAHRSGLAFLCASANAARADAVGELCAQCGGVASCRACGQRRSRAWRLVDIDGLSVAEAAMRMGIASSEVRRLVALHRDALELRALKQDSIPVARLRAFFETELARQPGLTRAEVARRLRISQSDLDRRLGYRATRHSAAADKRRVGIQQAGETVRALGRAPHELEGC